VAVAQDAELLDQILVRVGLDAQVARCAFTAGQIGAYSAP
jgi:hypothetical protein